MKKIEVIVNFQQSLFKKKLIILYILNIVTFEYKKIEYISNRIV